MSPKKESPMVRKLCRQLTAPCGRETADRICAFAMARWQELCTTCPPAHQDMEQHTRRNIYPSIAVFEGLLKEGYSREKAAALVYDAFGNVMESTARLIRGFLKIPFLYRTMPRIWKAMLPRLFSPEGGFVAEYYPTGNDRIKFDMKQCPYMETCQRLGCPEIAPAFCHSDDVTYGNMHRKLKWNRTKTLARGGDCCDFDLIVEK